MMSLEKTVGQMKLRYEAETLDELLKLMAAAESAQAKTREVENVTPTGRRGPILEPSTVDVTPRYK